MSRKYAWVISLLLLVSVATLFAKSHVPAKNTRDAIKAYVKDAAKVVAKSGPSCDTFKSADWMAGDYYVFVDSPDNNTIVAEIFIAAPPERVFEALTDPKQMAQWWGEKELYKVSESKIDLRVGGDRGERDAPPLALLAQPGAEPHVRRRLHVDCDRRACKRHARKHVRDSACDEQIVDKAL